MKESKSPSASITRKMLAELSPELRAHIAKIEKFMKWRKKEATRLRRDRLAYIDKLRKFDEWEKRNSPTRFNGGRQFFKTNQDEPQASITSQNWDVIFDICGWFRRNDKRGRNPRGPHTGRLGRAIWAKFFEKSSESPSKRAQDFILHYVSANKSVSPFFPAISGIAQKDDLQFFVEFGRAIEEKRRKPPPNSLFDNTEWTILSNWDRSAVMCLPLKYFIDYAAYCAVRYLLEKRVPAVDPTDAEERRKRSDMYKHWRMKLGLRKPEQALVHSVESSEGRLVLKDVCGEEVRVRLVMDLPGGRQMLQFSSPTLASKCGSGLRRNAQTN